MHTVGKQYDATIIYYANKFQHDHSVKAEPTIFEQNAGGGDHERCTSRHGQIESPHRTRPWRAHHQAAVHRDRAHEPRAIFVVGETGWFMKGCMWGWRLSSHVVQTKPTVRTVPRYAWWVRKLTKQHSPPPHSSSLFRNGWMVWANWNQWSTMHIIYSTPFRCTLCVLFVWVWRFHAEFQDAIRECMLCK